MNAFMNNKGGIVFAGIHDDGTVYGLKHITRFVEDKFRTLIASAVMQWSPKRCSQVLQAYEVFFVDVIRKESTGKYYELPNTKVIVVNVFPVFTKTRQIIFQTGFDHNEAIFQRADAMTVSLSNAKVGRFNPAQETAYVSKTGLEFEIRKAASSILSDVPDKILEDEEKD